MKRNLNYILPAFIFMIACYSHAADKPNLIIFLADDLGWGDIHSNGNDLVETPNIDSIATQGARFSTFLVNPVCSPTRAALLTGRHAIKTGVYSVTRGGDKFRESEITLAEILKDAGYATGAFGKWHNGAHFPHTANGQGFDEFVGFSDGHQTLYFDAELEKNNQRIQSEGYIADVLTDHAIEFIKQNQQQPFFAYVPFNTPHGPFELPEDLFNKYKQKGLSDLDASIYGMTENMDYNIGRITALLNKLKLDKNTIVMFMSDNGPAFPNGLTRFNGQLKGSKGKVDLGGILSPLYIKFPGKIPAGKTVEYASQHIDILPSALKLMDIAIPKQLDLDGIDVSSALTKAETNLPDRLLFTHHFRNTQRRSQDAIQVAPASVLQMPWFATIDRNENWSLYNIKVDPEQKHNIASQHTNKLNELKNAYLSWFKIASMNIKEIPTHIGHQEQSTLKLTSHEANISGQGIDYAHGAGWAHDWITVDKTQSALLDWPIRNVKPGKYRFSLGYNSSNTLNNLNIKLVVGSKTCKFNHLTVFSSSEDYGDRKYFTDEAPERNWKESNNCVLDLEEGDMSLMLDFENNNYQSLEIKHIKVERM